MVLQHVFFTIFKFYFNNFQVWKVFEWWTLQSCPASSAATSTARPSCWQKNRRTSSGEDRRCLQRQVCLCTSLKLQLLNNSQSSVYNGLLHRRIIRSKKCRFILEGPSFNYKNTPPAYYTLGRIVGLPDFRSHLKSGQFAIWFLFHHSKSRCIWISGPFILLTIWFTNQPSKSPDMKWFWIYLNGR